jgi:hypothetical protein
MTQTRLCRPGTSGMTANHDCADLVRWTAKVCGHDGTATDDSLGTRLLPATIALRNHIGRGFLWLV